MPGEEDVTQTTELLRAWSGGDHAALDQLTPRIYDELHRLASRLMSHEKAGATLQTTALIHEAYLKLVDVNGVDLQHRAQFFALSAQIMRRILLDRARRRLAVKRGGAAGRANLDQVADKGAARASELLALDDALKDLEKFDARKAQVIELRFFAGLSVGETADVLKVSPDTVMRDWRLARAWLHRQLE